MIRQLATSLLLSVVVGSGVLHSQEPSGVIAGRVLAEGDTAAIVGAVVLVTGTPLTALTSEGGEFRIEGVTPGRYTVQVVVYGYDVTERAAVEVVAGQVTRIEMTVVRAVIEVPGLVVTATRNAVRPGESPASVAVQTGQEVFRRQAITVDDALPFAQGVVFNANQIDIRGSTGIARGVGSRVLMLLDGHRVLAGVSGGVNFALLPIMDMRQLEIVKGPHSTLWGNNALGGVVNLLSQRPPDQPETVVRFHYGVFDTPSEYKFTDNALNMQGLNVQHSRWIGSVGTTLLAGYESSDGFRQNGSFDRIRLRAKTVVGKETDSPVEAFVNWVREDKEEFFTWLSEDRPLEVDSLDLGDWVRQDDLVVGLKATPINTQSVSLQIKPQLYYNSVKNNFHDNQTYHRSTRAAADVQLSTNPLARHFLTFGSETAGTAVSSDFVGDPFIWDVSVYGQDEIRLSSKVKGVVGLRLDFHSATTSESELNLSPKLGVVFQPNSEISLRSSVSRGYRAPAPSEQFTNTTQFGFRVVPNLELRGETAWAAEVGLTVNPLRWLWLDAAFFHTDYSDLIEASSVPGQLFVFQFRNVADARVTGFDAGAKFSIVPDMLGLDINYMFLDTENKTTGQALPYRSSNNVTATLWAFHQAVGIDFRYRTAVEEVLAYPLDPRGDITVVDVRFGYRLFGIDLQAKVTNLLQAKYVDVQERNPGASRRFLLTVSPRF
jgi:outer membrane receptor protein involved in Fe transport